MPATRAERLRDAVALALLVGGAVLFAYAFRGMQDLAAGRYTLAPGEWATARWTHYRAASLAGGALAVLGLAAAAYSYWRRARGRGAPPP